MNKQFENSTRFRLLKKLHPLLISLCMLLCWVIYYVPRYNVEMAVGGQILLMLGYFCGLYYLEKMYHALAVGLVRVSELVYSQCLAILICDAFMYIAISLYCNRFVAFHPGLIMFAVQLVVSILWSLIANRIYFAKSPPPKTAIIYKKKSDLTRVQSIRYIDEHFNLQKIIENPSNDANALFAQLDDIQVLFVAGIEAPLRTDIAKFALEHGICCYFMPRLGEIIMNGAEHMSMFSEPVMRVQRIPTKSFNMTLKRTMDVVVSLLGLVITSPIMIATALAIKLTDGGSVFYRQNRLTLNGRVFSILKFRSMRENAEKDGVARLVSQNDDRITPIGKIIRATRIDELPQLINILRGDMSLIGPRPERPEIAEEYEKLLPEFPLRLQVKAGLSGLAQVYGRYNTDPYSKLQMDLMYINKISLITDISLILATIKVIFLPESTEGVQANQRTAAIDELEQIRDSKKGA